MTEQNAARWGVACAAPLVVLGLVVFLIAWLVGAGVVFSIIIALVLVALIAALLWFGAETITSRLIGATSPGSSMHPRLANTVEELCARTGVSEPELLMINSDFPDAVAYGTSPGSAHLAVTNGLLNQLSVVELEGVIARELGRIRSGAIRFDTLGVAFVRAPLSIFGGLGGRLVDWARGNDREVQDDLIGVDITRYPPGLVSALGTIRTTRAEGSVTCPGSKLTDHLWVRGQRQRAEQPGQWSLDERIAVLQEL